MHVPLSLGFGLNNNDNNDNNNPQKNTTQPPPLFFPPPSAILTCLLLLASHRGTFEQNSYLQSVARPCEDSSRQRARGPTPLTRQHAQAKGQATVKASSPSHGSSHRTIAAGTSTMSTQSCRSWRWRRQGLVIQTSKMPWHRTLSQPK